jgi:alanyl-tRNA synthetase
MKSKELREKYFEFFKEKGHALIPSASLVPENDPSVLFTTAGMHPLVPYLLGENHPKGTRLVNVQKCVRTGDLDEVGDNTHLSFFEMLGNWSLGDYFKNESIEYSFEFLTSERWLGIPVEKLAITVFAGDADAPFDAVSYDKWLALGISDKRIAKLGKEDNWWPAGGKHPGPQGPDTEIFYWTGEESAPEVFDPKDKSWVEIWNNVFMEFNRTAEGVYEPLKQKNVDTGMGLERTLAVLNNKDNVFDIDVFIPLFEPIGDSTSASARIIADHIRTAVFMIADGVLPSNTDRGYILRRLLRRAFIHAKKLDKGISELNLVATEVMSHASYKDLYEFSQNTRGVISEELTKFEKTLDAGLKKFEKGEDPFILFTTYGFPFELTKELAKEKGVDIDEKDFKDKFEKHQELSRVGAEQKFKGGLADTSEETVKYHTATHLLHQALHDVLGDEVGQKGSNITPERLRFDFSFPRKLTDEEKKKVEDIVNEKIQEALPVHQTILPKDEALKVGARHFFDQKYPDEVSVYYIGESLENAYSKEFCGGPHVENIGTLGHFKITKEEAVSAGVRRIKAILE